MLQLPETIYHMLQTFFGTAFLLFLAIALALLIIEIISYRMRRK